MGRYSSFQNGALDLDRTRRFHSINPPEETDTDTKALSVDDVFLYRPTGPRY